MLRGLLEALPDTGGPDLLVGLTAPDDAAVYRLGGGRALVVSLDFFTPIVDDPHQFGQVAAANALSDLYAMGADPFLALSIAAFPANLPIEILTRIVTGAAQKVREAGAVLAGGHSVKDNEPKFGLAVLGFAAEDRLILKGGARPGDRLFLSKPIGTGVLSTALKADALDPEACEALIASMTRLSGGIARPAVAAGLRGGTDITGFALAGHAAELAQAAGVRLVLDWSLVPLLPRARELAQAGFVPGGSWSNWEAFSPRIEGLSQLDEAEKALLFDPQTSGGLLLAVPPAQELLFLAGVRAEGAAVWPVGRVEEGAGLLIEK